MGGKQQQQQRSTRGAGPRGQLQRHTAQQKQRRPRSMMFLCLALLVAMGRRTVATTATAFVTTPTKSFRSYSRSSKIGIYRHASSKTKQFFDYKNNKKHEYHRTNPTGMMMEGSAARTAAVTATATITTKSNESPTELSASSSSSDTCTTADSFVTRTNGDNNFNSNNNNNNNNNVSYKIYCDMDGCLVNFEKGVRVLLNTGSSSLEKRLMWEGISRAPLWFEQLEWQMDGRRLWSAIKHLNPDILTGVPDIQSSRVEKFNWCKRELGLEEADAHHVDMAADVGVGLNDHKSVNGNFPREDKTNVITCWSNNKYKECNRRGSILIDDRIALKKDWEAAGGIFIHHINTETTIRKLSDIGVISGKELDGEDWYWEGSWMSWRI